MTVRPVTAEEVAFFRERGWVHLPGYIDSATAERLRQSGEAKLADPRPRTEFGNIADRAFVNFPGENRQGPLVGHFITSPIMGRNMTRLLRVPQVRLFGDGYLLKMPEEDGDHDGTPYHQDLPGNPVDRSSFLTLWIALHDMGPEFGTMRFYNRSHRLGVFGQVFADGIDLRKRVPELDDADLSPPLAYRAGDATCHHSMVVHGTVPNTSGQRRWAYNMVYVAASARYTTAPGFFPQDLTLPAHALLDHPLFPILPTE
jgi:hypothetical protein